MCRHKWALICLGALLTAAFFVACSGGPAMNNAAGSTLTVTLSDPGTCTAPNGPFASIYVTIVDVKAHTSATAGDNDAGWQSLLGDSKGKPQQVNLLGIANNDCFLKTLGSMVLLQPANYQQLRVILADNANLPANNACKGNYGNCVYLTAEVQKDPVNAPSHPLLLSSETKTGIKIPSGQITGGQFSIAAGESKDLNIDFNACASIVMQGNGGFRLKPVLHAGTVTPTNNNITGKVVASDTLQPITNANVVVALELKDGNGNEVVKQQVVPDGQGNFAFCPVADPEGGKYDVVAVAFGNNGVDAYAPTITTGVLPGAALSNVKMFKVGAPANIQGRVTSQKTGPAGTAATVTLALWQQANLGSTVNVVIPLAMQSDVEVSLDTEQNTNCPTNTFCKPYTMVVPAGNAAVGTFAPGGATYTAPSGTVGYFVNATAFIPAPPDSTSTPALDCLPNSTIKVGPVTVTAGQTNPPAMAPDINFTGCQ